MHRHPGFAPERRRADRARPDPGKAELVQPFQFFAQRVFRAEDAARQLGGDRKAAPAQRNEILLGGRNRKIDQLAGPGAVGHAPRRLEPCAQPHGPRMVRPGEQVPGRGGGKRHRLPVRAERFQLFQHIAAQAVQPGDRQGEALPDLAADVPREERGAARFSKLLRAPRFVDGAVRRRLGGDEEGRPGKAALLIPRGQRHRLPGAYAQGEPDRDGGAFFPVKLVQPGKDGLRRPGHILLRADSEHVPAKPAVRVSGRKAGAGKDRGKVMGQLRWHRFAVRRKAARGGGGRDVFGAFHAPLYFGAVRAGAFQLADARDHRKVLQAQVVPRAARHRKRQPARLGAHPTVPAARAEHRAEIALPRNGHAQCPVDEHLQLDGAVPGAAADLRDFAQRKLARQHHAGNAERRERADAGGRGDGHLGGGVQPKGRRAPAQQAHQTHVLNDQRIHRKRARVLDEGKRLRQLILQNQRVHGEIHLHAARVTEFSCLPQRIIIEIFGGRAGGKGACAQIDRVGARAHGSQ